MLKILPPLVGVLLSIVTACGSDGSSGGTPREGGASGGGANAGAPNCDAICPAVVGAKCSGGPATQADCVGGCQTILAGKCAAKYDALYACAGQTPRYTCDSAGHVTVSGCESDGTALYTCLAGG